MDQWLPSIFSVIGMIVAGTIFVASIKGSVDRLSDAVNHLRDSIEEVKNEAKERANKVEHIDRRLTVLEVHHETNHSCVSVPRRAE